MERKISDKSGECFITSVRNYRCHKSHGITGKSQLLFLAVYLIFYAVICPLKSFAVPAYDGLFELKQPSGFSFEARQRGDEWYNWVETKDGYGIYKNTKTGNWEYYLPSTDAETKGLGIVPKDTHRTVVGEIDPASRDIPKGLRPPRKLPQMKREIIEKAPISGTKYLLVIGVDYATTTATYTPAEIQRKAFGSYPSNSISDYYSEASYSAVTIMPASETHGTYNDGFIGWLRLSGSHPNPEQYKDIDEDKRWRTSAQIAKDAILAADPYINYSSYDTSGNGIIEPTELSIMVIVAGYEASFEPTGTPSVWGHHWTMVSVGYPVVGGKEIHEYAEFGEKHNDHLATIGIMCHELGHLMFSLPDLYDTDDKNGDSYGVGYFDLMGGGSWGARDDVDYAGSIPTYLSAWSKEYLSWGKVTNVSVSQKVSFPKADGNSSSIFRIDTLKDLNQYFLVENRHFTGYDIGFQRETGPLPLGHGGLVIYHIDTLKTNLWPGSNTVNADVNDKGVDVEEANEGSLGYSMLDRGTGTAAHTNMFFFSGNKNNTFTDSTTPNSKLKNSTATNIAVTNISNYSDTMTATVTVPGTATTNIAGGEEHSLALKADGTVWAWGGNSAGQLGDGTYTRRTTPVQSGLGGVTAITCGAYHSLALKSDGTVWAWGSNGYGQLGDGTYTMRTTPVQVSGLNGVTAITCGAYHSLALKSDGTVWAWGGNNYGQLGDGTYTDRTTPVQVSGLGGVGAISGGYYHSLALKSDGTVWAWGLNNYDQLGDGTYTNRTTPVQVHMVTPSGDSVSFLSGVTAIEGGGVQSLALKSNGTVWKWGGFSYKNSSTLYDSVAEQVSGLSSITAISSANDATFALKSDDTVWWWENIRYAQSGGGTEYTPVQVSGLSDVTAIEGGGLHALAVKSDGTVWAWGDNQYGQLGDGTTTDSNIPVQVKNLNLIVSVTPTVTPTPTPTKSVTPTPTPTVTPTPAVCEPEAISVSPTTLKLKRKKSGTITVTVTGAEGCPVDGETVTATINSVGKKRISVSPTSDSTDENGRALFTITAKNKIGNARITFKANSLKKVLSVNIQN